MAMTRGVINETRGLSQKAGGNAGKIGESISRANQCRSDQNYQIFITDVDLGKSLDSQLQKTNAAMNGLVEQTQELISKTNAFLSRQEELNSRNVG